MSPEEIKYERNANTEKPMLKSSSDGKFGEL